MPDITRPHVDQILFRSSKTGDHVLDDYLEAAEIGEKSLSALIQSLFDTTGAVKSDLLQIRLSAGREIEVRFGEYEDLESGWRATGIFQLRTRGEWITGAVYKESDIVSIAGFAYLCNADHTAGASPDMAKFTPFIEMSGLQSKVDEAAASATTATAAASSATASASSATTSAATATTKAGEASVSASSASDNATIANTAAINAQASRDAASTSETNAANSATSASASASTATTKASAASTSATNAANSALSAAAKATEAQNSAATASGSASTATTKATEASSSAGSASNSATAAAASEGTATTKAAEAAASAALAESYASSALNRSFRNKIINGGFDVWQERTEVAFLSAVYAADQWRTRNAGTLLSGSAQLRMDFPIGQVDVPGAKHYLRRQVTSFNAVTQDILDYGIEGVHTLAGKTATLSFYARADANRTLSVALSQYFGSGGSTGVLTPDQQANLTTEWQRFSFTFAVPSIDGKTISADGTDSLWVALNFPLNALYTIDLARFQLEEGDVASPFEERPFALELLLCQRYWEKSFPYDVAPANGPNSTTFAGGTNGRPSGMTTAGQAQISQYFRVPKRATPSMTYFGNSTGQMLVGTGSGSSWVDVSTINRYFSTEGHGAADSTNSFRSLLYHWTANARLA